MSMSEFDRLVEQQDQEIALNGYVSPFTQMQLDALANGEPVPHVYDTPEMQRLTEQLRRRLHGGYDEEDDLLFYEEVSRG